MRVSEAGWGRWKRYLEKSAVYLDVELPMSPRHGLLRLRCKDRVGKGKGEALGLFPSPAAAGDAEGKPGPTPCGAHPALSQDGLEPRIRRGGTGAASTEAAPFLSARPRALLRGSGAGTGKKKTQNIYIYFFMWGKKKGKMGREGGRKRGGKGFFLRVPAALRRHQVVPSLRAAGGPEGEGSRVGLCRRGGRDRL